jgi:hypothetical protein
MPWQPKAFYPRPANVNQDNQRSGVNSDSQLLRTLPQNHLLDSTFLASSHIHTIGENTKAMVLGATGLTQVADLSVTSGHKHNTRQGRLRWTQLATQQFFNSPATADDIEDSFVIDTVANTQLAVMRLWLPLEAAKSVYARIRLSVAPAPSANNLYNLVFKYYSLAGVLLATQSPLAISTVAVLSRVWFECPYINLSSGTVDATFTDRIPLWVEVSATAGAVAEFVYIHEISFGVYDL